MLLTHLQCWKRWVQAWQALGRVPVKSMPWGGPRSWERDHFNGFTCKLHRFPIPRDSQYIIDIGANVGLFSQASLAYCPKATVVAFEPSSEAFASLSARLSCESRLRARQMAVGARAGKATLTVARHLASSTLLSETESAQRMFGSEVGGTGQQEEVGVTTLDHVVKQEGISMVDLLKIDVEGFEPEVLGGGVECLRHRVQHIIVECSIARLGLPKVLALLDSLRGLGFILVDLNDVHRSTMDAVHSAAQFDAWFAHERLGK